MRVCWGQSDHITWWLCWCLQLSGFPCSYNWRDYCASSLYVQRTRSVDFVCWVRFLSLFVKKVGRRIQAAGDVCCEAVGWMERSHVPQQQSGLIVGFTINLQKEKNNWILDTCFFFFFFKIVHYIWRHFSCSTPGKSIFTEWKINGISLSLTCISPYAWHPTGLVLALSFPAGITPLRKGVTPTGIPGSSICPSSSSGAVSTSKLL